VAGNSFIQSLREQVASAVNNPAETALAVISGNPDLDLTAVARLRAAGGLVLRTTHEALSKTLEQAAMVEAITWALTEAGVSTLTLIGHSRSATIPIEQLGGPLGLMERMRLGQERLAASKLKLKDDLARFARNLQIARLLSDHQTTLQGLFYIQESGAFLKYDLEAGDFAPLGETTSH